MDAGKRILFEGAQGTLLDIDHGTYPYVTSSNASAAGAWPGTGVPSRAIGQILGVVKAYTTRVGEGPFPTELKGALGDQIREQGHEYGTTTGRPRRCGWLDTFAIRYAAPPQQRSTASSSRCWTCWAGCRNSKICTGYTVGGRPLAEFPDDPVVLEQAQPILEDLEPWKEDISGARSYRELPRAARAVRQARRGSHRAPVRIISVGPSREQTIFRP